MVLTGDELSLGARGTGTGECGAVRLLAVLAHVLGDVGDDWLALVTGSRYKDILASVRLIWLRELNRFLRQNWLHRRLLKVLV